MKIKPNVLFLSAGRLDYPSNAISIRVLQKNFPAKLLVSRLKSYYTRTVSVALRLPFYMHAADIFYVGWMGQQFVPLIRIFSGKPIIFDIAPSLYDSFVDRGFTKKDSLLAKFLFWLDQFSYRQSYVVIMGDQGSRVYFSELFNIPKDKFRIFPICANNELFYPRATESSASRKKEFIVEFVGEMAPQHGVRYIMEAAKHLEGTGIVFRIAGTGQCLGEVCRMYEELQPSNVTFLPYRIPLEQLLQWRSEADLCLGLFGDTPKAHRSLSNKLYEAFAMKKAFLTAGPPKAFGITLHFKDAYDCFFGPVADGEALAKKILWVRDNNELRMRVAEQGRKTYENMCREDLVEKRIIDLVMEASEHT